MLLMKRENTIPKRKSSCQCWVCSQRSIREYQGSSSSDAESILRSREDRPQQRSSNIADSYRHDEAHVANTNTASNKVQAPTKTVAMEAEVYFNPNSKYPDWTLYDFLACPICYEVMVETSLTNCGHTFCRICVSRWQARKKGRCPVCNTRIRTTTRCYSLDRLIDSISHVLPRYTQEKLAAAERFRLNKAIKDSDNLSSLRGQARSLTMLWSKTEILRTLPSCTCSSCTLLTPCYVIFGLVTYFYDLLKSCLKGIFHLDPLAYKNQIGLLLAGLIIGIALAMLIHSCRSAISNDTDTFCAYLIY